MPSASPERPLAGVRVLVTRAPHQAGALSGRLAEAGAEVLELPAIVIADPESFEALDAALLRLSGTQGQGRRSGDVRECEASPAEDRSEGQAWLGVSGPEAGGAAEDWQGRRAVAASGPEASGRLAEGEAERGGLAGGSRGYDVVLLGSINAAERMAARARALDVTVDVPVTCVGEKTRRRLEDSELATVFRGEQLIPEVYRAEAMVERVVERFGRAGRLDGVRVLFPRAPEGREVSIERLRALGAKVDPVVAYRIQVAPPASEEARAEARRADVVTFLSGETMAAFLHVLPEAEGRQILERATVAVIGPVAAEKAEALGVRVDLVPPEATVESLVAALATRCAGADRPDGSGA